ncbi:MAG: hypothetical protein R2856_03095 [Caldilineaceae bacterium]
MRNSSPPPVDRWWAKWPSSPKATTVNGPRHYCTGQLARLYRISEIYEPRRSTTQD